MAITSEDIQQQSFKIERRGYDVDEVDVFLEHVSDEIDALNDEIAHLRAQLAEAKSAPASANQQQQAAPSSEDSAALAEKDARIAELESQLGERKSEDNAIAQALIIEQISELTVSREKVREQYQEMLKDFIAASTKRLSEIGGDNTSDIVIPEGLIDEDAQAEPVAKKWSPSPSTATYTTPTVNPAVASTAPPKPSQSSKDLSGYGDADDSFTFDEID